MKKLPRRVQDGREHDPTGGKVLMSITDDTGHNDGMARGEGLVALVIPVEGWIEVPR
jgi:hypothetical protein